MGTNRANTATHLEFCGYQPGQYCHPLGILWVPTGPILPTHLEFCGYQPGQYCQPTWNSVRTNRANTATHLEFCGYQPDLYCQPTWNSVGTNRIYTANSLGIIWVPTGPVLQSAQSRVLLGSKWTHTGALGRRCGSYISQSSQ